MLVIRRRPGEAVLIGSDVEIEILEASGSHVKLGIRAPREIPVVRKEIQLVEQQNRAASQKASAQGLSQLLHVLQRQNSHNTGKLR